MNNSKSYKKITHQLCYSFPFILLFIFLIYEIGFDFSKSLDDVKYLNVPIDFGFGNYLIERYQSWSSRLLVDSLAAIIVKMPDICIIMILSLAYVFIAYNISILLNPNREMKNSVIICLLMLTFPYEIEESAGIVATTVNYIFPVLFALICLNYFIKLNNNKIKNKNSFIYTIAFLIATDSEQIILIAFISFIIYFIYNGYHKKENNKYLIAYFCILICKIIFVFICPGNHLRYDKEIIDWYKAYAEFNFIDKIYMSIVYSTRVLFANPIIFTVFSIQIFYLTFLKSSSKTHMIIATISTFLTVVLYFNANIVGVICINGPEYNFLIVIPILMFIINILLLNIFQKDWLLLISMYVLGIISQMLMAFSPTIYVSSYRTGTIMYFSFIILNYYCTNEIWFFLKSKIVDYKKSKLLH